MSTFARACMLVAAVCATLLRPATGTEVPALSATGWDGDGENEFTPPKSGPGPVTSDPTHPYVSNPILKPWVIEELRKANADALAGKAMFTREARCWPTGVPAMLLNPGRLYFVQ